MIGYNDVISFFRNTQWLIGIIPSIITFFTARWLFNKKVKTELEDIKKLFCEKKYTGETFFNINFKDGTNNLDKSPNIRNVCCVKIDADKFKYDNKEVKAYIVIVEHEQLEGYPQLKQHPCTNCFRIQSSGKYCTILGVMTNKTDDSQQQYKITFSK